MTFFFNYTYPKITPFRTSSQRFSLHDCKLLLELWNDGEEKNLRVKGFHVTTVISCIGNCLFLFSLGREFQKIFMSVSKLIMCF